MIPFGLVVFRPLSQCCFWRSASIWTQALKKWRKTENQFALGNPASGGEQRGSLASPARGLDVKAFGNLGEQRVYTTISIQDGRQGVWRISTIFRAASPTHQGPFKLLHVSTRAWFSLRPGRKGEIKPIDRTAEGGRRRPRSLSPWESVQSSVHRPRTTALSYLRASLASFWVFWQWGLSVPRWFFTRKEKEQRKIECWHVVDIVEVTSFKNKDFFS